MREFGVTRIVTPEGLTIERPPASPLEASLVAAASAPGKASRDDEDDDAQEEPEKDLMARWRSHWQRLTLSSGASIPAFPGREQALRMLGPS